MTKAKESDLLTKYTEINKIFGGIPEKSFWCFRFRNDKSKKYKTDMIFLINRNQYDF